MGDGVARCSNVELPHYDPDMLASTYLKAEVSFTRIIHFILYISYPHVVQDDPI